MKVMILVGALMAFSASTHAKAKDKVPNKAGTAILKVWSLVDYTDSNRSLERAKIFKMDLAFVDKYNPIFYLFMEDREYTEKLCFEGPATEAAKIIDAILNVATGDAYVYPKIARITDQRITQAVEYEDEGGYHDFELEVNRCK